MADKHAKHAKHAKRAKRAKRATLIEVWRRGVEFAAVTLIEAGPLAILPRY